MGNTCCSGADPTDTKVQKEIDADQKKDMKENKLLFLGAGGSGKTTLFKQLQYIHGEGYTEADKQKFQAPIWEQMVDALQIMIKVLTDQEGEYHVFENESERPKISPNLQASVDYILNMDGQSGVEMNDEVANHVKCLWEDDAIQKVYALRAKCCVADSTAHFMNNIDRICRLDYAPTDEDLLLVRYRTLGMNEKIFEIGPKPDIFRFVDVGGQRNERRKWINFFDSVTAVIFVASLSCYDEVVFEDEDTNAMHEALGVFEEQINNQIFADTAFILFLNKSDLFHQKILNVPITPAFPDYNGPQEAEACYEYIKQQFKARAKDQERHIYVHCTNATDKDNVEKVFNDVQHIVVSQALSRAGLIGDFEPDAENEAEVNSNPGKGGYKQTADDGLLS